MKILYFHQYFNTPDSTGGTRSYEMARQMIARGHHVTMICAQSGNGDVGLPGNPDDKIREGFVDGIHVIQFNLAYNNYMSLLKRACMFLQYAFNSVRLALHLDYDLVFATSTPLTAGIPGIFARYFRRKPFVFEVRDLWPELPKAMGVVKNPFVLAGMSVLEWLSYRASVACIALSPGIKKGIEARSPKGREVVMIPNGCDLSMFQPGNREDLTLPGVGQNDCVAIFTGAHGMANGLDAVLDAAHVLKERARKDIVLVFIGDGKLKPHLMERARTEQLENCRFLDPIPKNKLNNLVSCCDVGMMILANVPAFYYGTSPNKFFDYISSGLPVLNNYPGWLAGLITDNACGEAVLPNRPEAFADAMCYLADNLELRKTYGENARRLAKTSFSRNQLANNLVDFLEKIIK